MTRGARQVRDGARPAVLYSAAQHAREWITPEMNRRLLHHVVDGYATDARDPPAADAAPSCGSCRWPTPTATTTPSPRATGCGARTCATTTATARSPASTASTSNRNYPTKWGYDNEGSSPSYGQRDLPRHRARPPSRRPGRWTGCCGASASTFQVNYHSAAELLLYGVGWQVATRSPDDLIFEAQAGDDAAPGDPGLRPRPVRRALHHQRRDRPSTRTTPTARSPTPRRCRPARPRATRDPDDAFEAGRLRERRSTSPTPSR